MNNLNTRLDQSLDQIIKDTRSQRKKGRGTTKKKATATKATAAAANGAKKPTRRVKNKAKRATTAISPEEAAIAGTKGAIAARLGAGANVNKVLGKGKLSGRVGKVNSKASKVGTSGRLAGLADKRKKGKPAASKNVRISIKGEAGPATVFVSNLDTEASADDVKTCFKQFGTIKNCTLLYDHSGRASGHAEITYVAKAAADEAVANLNNALADGRTLSVRLTQGTTKPSVPQTASFAAAASGASQQHSRRGSRKTKRQIGGGRMDID
ncbi:hypothetical protein IW140_003194 [Coemansia sp. RSA 1813]|nr:hypothetical protein EV178_003122 [Coemansia sp. RSA 1646]KAJ1773952.1 hypothetical protein LPJ74_000051 [Coemansia sp. RSA 1843]KAJ2089328.1 hypothetical protein IW138_003494 [Coemansia sp. RSA 986]KAJ2214431.1 hypothetical protein EV179_002972 [Coemansia sp. RSA 487]KAJ2569347.1 hypothetical protein IW140_003194 [Coemansia sp. RSA 1813]